MSTLRGDVRAKLRAVHLVLALTPRARTILPAAGTALLLSVAAVGCGKSGTAFSAGPEAPSRTAVVNGRFVTSVEMGHGTLLVTPPPDGARAAFSESKAWTIFQSADVTEGSYSFAVMGLALASLLPGSTSTTTKTSTTTTTTTTTTPTTTTAAPTATTSTTAPPPALPTYERRLAWVGIAFGGPACPAGAQRPVGTSSSTQVAVMIDATNGHDVLAFTGDSGLSCNAAPGTPTVVRPNELESVPWQPVGPASTAVQATVPACGHYVGWTEVAGPTSQSAIEVVASVPFDSLCSSSAPLQVTVDDVVPLGSSPQQLAHASLGPVQSLRVLPGGEVGAPGTRGS